HVVSRPTLYSGRLALSFRAEGGVMTQARGIRQVGYFDGPGGGQVVVSGTTAFVAHMKAPHGTTIVDVIDPARPRKLAEVTIPAGVHSHKVRAVDGVMLVNLDAPPRAGVSPDFRGGVGILEVADLQRPRQRTFAESNGLRLAPSLGPDA